MKKAKKASAKKETKKVAEEPKKKSAKAAVKTVKPKKASKAKMSEDEGALYVATLYFCGIVKAGLHGEASPLLLRISSIAQFGLSKHTISEDRWNKFSMAIQQANDDSKMSLE